MTFEFITYLILVIFTLFLSFERKATSYSAIIGVLIIVFYIITVRLSGFDRDFFTYNQVLKFPLALFFTSSYYIKEPIYWLGSKLLYIWFENELIVYYIFDSIVLILIYKAIKNFKLPIYFLLFYFAFFPNMLGHQNIYRQFIATAFLIYSLSLSVSGHNNVKKVFFFIIGCLTHNVIFLFFPLLYAKSKTTYGRVMYWGSSLVIFILLPFFISTKSNSETGLSLSYLYLVLVFLYFILFLLVQSYKISKINRYYYLIAINTLCLMIIVWLFLGSAQSERTGMIILIILTSMLFKMIEEKFKNKVYTRVFFIAILILPTFIFKSALGFLFTGM